MFAIGAIGFTTPLLLLALVALPILWLLLRAVPPAPIRRRFPGVALLLGLTDDETQSDKTPWWLLLLRMLAIAAVIIGFAGPVLNPEDRSAGTGPLLVLADGGWGDAADWPQRQERIDGILAEAMRNGRPAALVSLTDLPSGDALPFRGADVARTGLPGFQPNPWSASETDIDLWVDAWPDGDFETVWLSDGLDRPGRATLLSALQTRGEVTVIEGLSRLVGLRPVYFEDGEIVVAGLRAGGAEAERSVVARGLDPGGIERDLARVNLRFAADDSTAEARLSLPPELRNRITRFEVEGQRSAAGIALADDALRRREVALLTARDDREGLELLSPTHYLQQALEPTADLIDGVLGDILIANPDVIILADVATISAGEAEPLEEWVNAGGLLVRFAGPRLAASDTGRTEETALMPVRLRAGGRTVGGAMSWGEPKSLRPFRENTPFFGLSIPEDVRVSAQVMAQPDPELSERVIASLTDGTPLVTRKRLGEGQVVLFHVTANAEWSTLPLSGLFVQMLERLAISTRPAVPEAEDLAGTVWAPDQVLTAFGQLEDAGTFAGVPGERLAEFAIAADMPPGLYAGADRRIAVNVLTAETAWAPADWPSSVTLTGLAHAAETLLKGYALAAALALLCLDIIGSLWVSGRLRRGGGTVATALMLGLLLPPGTADAQTDAAAIAATSEVVLAHVVTGDPNVDRVAAAGLLGLSRTLFRRTSIEPADPIAVDLETAELSFFPFLYWPVTPDQPQPSAAAYAKLNRYLRSGGMILFDTRDADIARFGASSPNGRKLQTLARPLDIPPLEPVPHDHVLTRTFYLLQDFPGRHAARDVWVEAAPADAEQIEGMPFRNLNDNVTPIVIGGNDWASAWAIDGAGNRMFPVGRGLGGERQRELAFRFGVNLIMHVLTGNYKSDQVHVPALLDRLGQ